MLGDTDYIALLGQLDEGVIIVSANYNVLYGNKTAIDYFGDKLLDVPIYNLIRNSEVIDAINDSAEINMSFPYTSSDGIYKLQLSYNQKPGKPGIIIINNQTEEENFDSIRRDLIANVSHELRSPLTSISGFIETLQNEKISQKQHSKFLNIMSEEANRMDRIISDLLSLSKIEINEFIEPQTEINLMEPILLAKNALELRANELGKKIIVDQKLDIAPIIKGDADQIIEVFHNLIDNAIKYSIENSTIKIILDVIDDINPKQISVTVENIGMGIGEEHLPRLTERFYRVDKARSRNIGGTGLGLAIVKHILLRHSADLEVSSQVNGKTRFTVLFPIYS
jgi:two-component system phosphate regulon sensor histidine kinase PhoR